MLRLSPSQSALQWDLWNGAAAWLWGGSNRYLRVRYEDLAVEPRATLARVAAFAGVSHLELPFTAADQVSAQAVHTVAGNADRMRSGPVTVRLDDAWRTELPTRSRRLVSALTAPLLARYGYPLSP
jgi:hypothetical protein